MDIHVELSLIAHHGKQHVYNLELAVVLCLAWVYPPSYEPVVIGPYYRVAAAQGTYDTGGQQGIEFPVTVSAGARRLVYGCAGLLSVRDDPDIASQFPGILPLS